MKPIDYREHPNFGQRDMGDETPEDRDHPVVAGTYVPPMHDKTIFTYDLPRDAGDFDQLGRGVQLGEMDERDC